MKTVNYKCHYKTAEKLRQVNIKTDRTQISITNTEILAS